MDRSQAGSGKLFWMIPVQLVAVLLMTVPPWLLGGVQAISQFWLFCLGFSAMLACWGLSLTRGLSIRPLPVALIPLGLAILWAALQTQPLSADVHGALSPATLGWWQQLGPGEASDVPVAGFDKYPISLYPASTLREFYMLSLATAAFLLGATVLSDRWSFALAGAAVAINGAALAFFGLVQQITWNGKLFWSIPLTGGGTPFASYVNRNNAAGFLNLCLACAVAWTVWGIVHDSYTTRRRTKVARNSFRSRDEFAQNSLRSILTTVFMPLARLNSATAIGLTAAGCIAAGILSSQSRGAAIAMVGGSVVTLLAAALAGQWRRGWLSPMILTGLLGCLLVVYSGQGDTVSQRLATVFDEDIRQADGRWVNWKHGWQAATDLLPAGSGLGTYRYVYRLYQQEPHHAWFYHAENQYLQALVEAGLPGLVLLLSVLSLVALACWRLLYAPDAASYALGLAGTFALSSQAIHAFFDFGLYLPANMLLLAMICGSVCGRAAWLGGRDAADATRTQRWSASLVALPVLRPLAASCCVALTGLLLLGASHAHGTAKAATVLADARHLDLQQTQSLEALNRAIRQLSSASASRSEDVEVQLQLARLWTARMRAGLLESMLRDATNPIAASSLWPATDTTQLHGRLQEWTAQQRTAEATAFRSAAAVAENVPRAIQHLQTARRLCPLLPEIHLMLAELTVLAADGTDNQPDLQRVRATAPGQPAILTRCGWLELQAGRIDRACECWQASLRLSPGQFPEILRVARPRIDLARHIDRLVPESPEWILDQAVPLFDAESDRPIRRALLTKAERLVQSSGGEDAQSSWLLGRIAMLRNDGRQAVAHFTRALALRPDQTGWRYELAIALKQSGRYHEAQEHARVCWRMEPDNADYEALLREVTRARLAAKRSS